MKKYYINNNQTRNPGLHHEVHTEEHAQQLKIANKTYLGEFSSETAQGVRTWQGELIMLSTTAKAVGM